MSFDFSSYTSRCLHSLQVPLELICSCHTSPGALSLIIRPRRHLKGSGFRRRGFRRRGDLIPISLRNSVRGRTVSPDLTTLPDSLQPRP